MKLNNKVDQSKFYAIYYDKLYTIRNTAKLIAHGAAENGNDPVS